MKFKDFQIHDYAAAAMTSGVALAHDTGLGKSLAAEVLPLLWCGYDIVAGVPQVRAPVLIVAPGDLHDQLKAEFKKFFGIVPQSITDQEDLLRLLVHRKIPRGFYITSYTRLAVNGVKKISDLAKAGIESAADELNLYAEDLRAFHAARGDHYKDEYGTLGVKPDVTQAKLDGILEAKLKSTERWDSPMMAQEARFELRRCHALLSNFTPPFEPVDPNIRQPKTDFIWRELIGYKIKILSEGVGETHDSTPTPNLPDEGGLRAGLGLGKTTHRIKCIYSPSMADLCSHLFECVVIDEGVKMKGADTIVGRGLRQMSPKYRLVLTATPVKNRLPDIFWLAWWAAGGHEEATARWPYAGTAAEQEKFAETFMLSEFNKTKAKENKSNQKSRFTKLRPEICNLHLLWKALGPIVLRRRKQDVGEAIVKKVRHVYRVPMGLHQCAVYRYHLESSYLDCNLRPAPGAKLQALRVASAAPDSHLLDPQPGGDDRTCCGDPQFPGTDGGSAACRSCGSPRLTHRSDFSFTPKVVCALNLVRDILRRDEQVAVFSAFHDPSDIFSRYLNEAGISHYLLDGRLNQARRGARSAAFNAGECPVTLAGIDSMAEGHNWDKVNNIILTSYTWAADKIIQAINRAHRLTSRKDVNLYVIICDQSADRVLEDNINEKTNSSELAIDGRLLAESTEERSISELLRAAMSDFHSKQDCPNEAELARTWPALRAELQQAAASWAGGARHPIAPQPYAPIDLLNFRFDTSEAIPVLKSEMVVNQKPVIITPVPVTPAVVPLTPYAKPNVPFWRRLRIAA